MFREDFSRQKIVYSEIVQSAQFYLDSDAFYIEATAFLMTGEKLWYLLGNLNSDLISKIFKLLYAGGGLGEIGYRYKKQFLLNLPIIKPSTDFELVLSKHSKEINQSGISDPKKDEISDGIEELLISNYSLSTSEKDYILNYSR